MKGAALRLLKYGDALVVRQPSAQYDAGSKPSANAAVTDMHSTRNGAVQASASACTSGPSLASRTSLTRMKSPKFMTGRAGKRTWTTRSEGMPRLAA